MEDELNCLLKAAAEGDEAAFERISEQFSPLVSSMSAGFLPSFASLKECVSVTEQDLQQEARLALYRAVLSYNRLQKDVSFGLYAKICIRNSMISALRKCSARDRAAKRSEARPATEREQDPLIHALASDGTHRLTNRIAQVLSPYEKTVFDLYISGRSVKCISLSVGKSEKSVHNAVYRIRVKIKGLLENS